MSSSVLQNKITCLEELQQEKVAVRQRIKEREKDLEERLQKLPAETIKTAFNSIFPFYIDNKIAGKTWLLIKNIIGFFAGSSSEKNESWKSAIISPAKQLGVFALIKLVSKFIKK